MSESLPPPFGHSDSISARHNLEGVTFAILIGIIPPVLALVGVPVFIYWCCKKCWQCGNGNSSDQNENSNCCTSICKSFTHANLNKISTAIITSLFSSVNKRLVAGNSCLLFAGRKEPNKKMWVHLYFLNAVALASLWFLAVFVDYLWYRKVASCNDVNTADDNYICYEIDEKGVPLPYERKSCNTIAEDQDVLCYIYTFSPFMALGIASSVTRTIVFIVDKAFSVALSLAESEYGCVLLVTAQFLAGCFGLVFLIAIPVLHTAQGKNISALKWFFQGRSGIRIFIFILTAVSVATLPMVPWCTFKGKRFTDTSQEDIKSQTTYCSRNETEGENYELLEDTRS